MEHKLVVHGCGGCGISQVKKATDSIKGYGEGFVEIDDLYTDTSHANKNAQYEDGKYISDDKFFLVTNSNARSSPIDGSGGVRQMNANTINNKETIDRYLNGHGYSKHILGVFHAVVFSGGGGTGSVVGPVLVNTMLSRKIPVIAIVTLDYNTSQLGMNSRATMHTLEKISKANDTPLIISVCNNNTVEESIKDSKDRADSKVTSLLSTLAIFYSQHRSHIDNQDMYSMHMYNQVPGSNIPKSGLFMIEVTTERDFKDTTSTPFIGRSMIFDDSIDPTITCVPDLISWKHGLVDHPNVIEHVGEALAHGVLTILITTGSMRTIIDILDSEIEERVTKIKRLKTETLASDQSDATNDTDNFLIF